MRLVYHDTGAGSGAYNMEYDLMLLEQASIEEGYIRLYRWDPYTISLGANQDVSIIDKNKCEEEGFDIVKRPTGGRAVLHAEELTYSVAMRIEAGRSVRGIYKEINEALMDGLHYYNPLIKAKLEEEQVNFNTFYRTGLSEACFAAPAKNEVKINGRKLIGSAQRRIGDKILQHGSIICGSYHKNIVNYLLLPDKEKEEIREELENKTEDLLSLTGGEVDYEKLKSGIIKGFSRYFKQEIHSVTRVEEKLTI